MTSMTEARKITRQDRCDRCGAAAQALVILPSGFELMFCGHHYRANEDQLIQQGGKVDTVVMTG